MHITPDMVERTYELLRTTLPFRRWGLAHPDQLEFRVSLHVDRFGHYDNKENKPGRYHDITISARHVTTLDVLVRVVAHEMVHQRLQQLKLRGWWQHGPRFQRLAKIVCQRHGFDREAF